MNIVIALVTGVVIGWGASIKSGTDGREDLIRNVVVSAVGAYLGGFLLTLIYDAADPTALSFGAVIASMSGAAASLVVVNRIRSA